MDECTESFGEAIMFCTRNASFEPWQIKIDKHDRDKAVLTSHYDLCRLTRMPPGLKNTPPTIQRSITLYLRLYGGSLASSISTILLYTLNQRQITSKKLDTYLRVLHEAGVTLKLQKRKLFVDIIYNLGHVIWTGRLELEEQTTPAVAKLKQPTTEIKLRLSWAYVMYLGSFCRVLPASRLPLNTKLRNDQTRDIGSLDKKKSVAVASSWKILTSLLVLALPRA